MYFQVQKNRKISQNIKVNCTCLEIKQAFILEDMTTFVISLFLKSNCSINMSLAKFKLSYKGALSTSKISQNIKVHCTCLEIKHAFNLEDMSTFVNSVF